ncbi:ATP-binding protein [Pseudomonas koreensis]|uniref:ATP-binding protein n=1 Tax=Pseudomonas koreensis TaxID=198620 RepID=UPI0021C6488F|nr:ATP-binding protein [Pseudomonas koreensis]MCU0070055.1 ATP-binding protein [Pseudomonas koreensis]
MPFQVVNNVGYAMLLAHLFIAEHKALSELNVPINGNFQGEFFSSVLTLRRKQIDAEYYGGFHCSALIGPNGVGKSSVLEVLELLTASTDSRALVVFYDQHDDKYFICGINMDMADVEKVYADSPWLFVSDNSDFLSRWRVSLVKVNNLPADEGLLTLSSRKSGKYVKELTVRENVKSIKRRKQYFEKMLDYFSDGQIQNDSMGEVAFAFSFSSSPVSILQGVLDRMSLSDSDRVGLVKEWYGKRSHKVSFDDDLSLGSVFQSLVALNSLSILSALAIDSGISKKLFLRLLVREFSEVDLKNGPDMNDANRLRHTLHRMRSTDVARVLVSGEEILSPIDVQIAVEKVEKHLEGYLSIFDSIAEAICDHCFDGESLDLNRVTTTDYFAIQKLTNLIGDLPGNVSANMNWGWRGISTGELARIHLFAEIYAFLKESGKDSNIIVIDEADLYLHPEWQRTFLYDLLNQLDNMRSYENITSPQIVLCTHSPIIISDFLPDNIISLRKDQDGQTEVVESFGFGNAIGDIYMDGMHLKSTFGEHAKQRLDRIIARARGGNLTDEDFNLIGKISNVHVRNFLLSHDKNK